MKEIIRKIILAILVCVFLFSGYQLVKIYLDYKQIDDTIDEVINIAVTVPEKEEKAYLLIDWEELKAINEDIVAWIHIPDTNINYPVLHGETNDTYIYHDLNKNYSIGGSIFIEANNSGDFSDDNTILYGHNMKNDSMFGDLVSFLEDDGYEIDHPYIHIYLPDGTVSVYQVAVSHLIDGTSPLYTTTITNRSDYLSMLNSGNVISNAPQINEEPLIMLSTCVTGDDEDIRRYVVHGQLVEKGVDPTTEVPQ